MRLFDWDLTCSQALCLSAYNGWCGDGVARVEAAGPAFCPYGLHHVTIKEPGFHPQSFKQQQLLCAPPSWLASEMPMHAPLAQIC